MSDKSWEPGMYECLNVLNLLSHFLTLTLALSHSHTLSISHSITLDMLNKFCFHLYAQNSLFIGENCNAFFDILLSTLTCYFRVHRAGSQLKMAGKLGSGISPQENSLTDKLNSNTLSHNTSIGLFFCLPLRMVN